MSTLTGLGAGDALLTHCHTPCGRLIQWLSGYWDHIVILAPHPKSGRLCVYEAAIRERNCLVRHRRIVGFRCRPLKGWIKEQQAAGCEVWHQWWRGPLIDLELGRNLASWCGTPYDPVGAFHARSIFWPSWAIPPKEDASSLFCSESVAIAWNSLGLKIGNTAAYSPTALANLAVRAGFAKKPYKLGVGR